MSGPVPRGEVEALLGRLHLDDEGRLGGREHRKAGQVHALLEHLVPLLRDAPRRRPLRVIDAAAGRGPVAAALAGLLLPALGLRGQVLVCEEDPERARRAAARFGECGLHDVVTSASAVRDVAPEEPPDLIVALHACGPASDEVVELAIRSGARRLALVPCCHRRAPELARRAGILVGGEAGERLSAAVQDGLRVLRLEAARYRVDSVALGGTATTGRDLVIRARAGGGVERAARARAALDSWRRIE